jgi:hypothetical protein
VSEALLLQIEQDHCLKNKGERSVSIWEKWGQFGATSLFSPKVLSKNGKGGVKMTKRPAKHDKELYPF